MMSMYIEYYHSRHQFRQFCQKEVLGGKKPMKIDTTDMEQKADCERAAEVLRQYSEGYRLLDAFWKYAQEYELPQPTPEAQRVNSWRVSDCSSTGVPPRAFTGEELLETRLGANKEIKLVEGKDGSTYIGPTFEDRIATIKKSRPLKILMVHAQSEIAEDVGAGKGWGSGSAESLASDKDLMVLGGTAADFEDGLPDDAIAEIGEEGMSMGGDTEQIVRAFLDELVKMEVVNSSRRYAATGTDAPNVEHTSYWAMERPRIRGDGARSSGTKSAAEAENVDRNGNPLPDFDDDSQQRSPPTAKKRPKRRRNKSAPPADTSARKRGRRVDAKNGRQEPASAQCACGKESRCKCTATD